ncbi:MAG TPA: ATP-binding protein, partial [Cyclobacteriaceae bacterium]|nr:ATP-binding protein [Cyclobacteriaceae bacterium]
PFYSDGARLLVIITSLLSNAMVFKSPVGPNTVMTEVITTDDRATISVRDNGIGMPPHVLSRIYDMFYRGHEKSRGAGLGLYIVKEIVTKLKGSIMVTSQEQEGTTVTVTLPNDRSCELY